MKKRRIGRVGRSARRLSGLALCLAGVASSHCGGRAAPPNAAAACTTDDDCTDGALCTAGSCQPDDLDGGSGASDGSSDGDVATGPSTSDKLDLLLVVDNSISMSDKQHLLGQSMGGFLQALTNPPCASVEDPADVVTVESPTDDCPTGYERTTKPADDVHIGVISTSLGGHGGEICSESSQDFNPTQDEGAHLTATLRNGLTTYQDRGFLVWDPLGQQSPPGEEELAQLIAHAEQLITSVGENGCGFESSLEAMYRFLADPNPYASIEVAGNVAAPTGTDTELLAQRAAFLRPDSAVMIVILSDENDCSVLDSELGWLISRVSPMYAATSTCDADPNSACCRSCGVRESPVPDGCEPVGDDPNCQVPRPDGTDPINLRCFHQKRRFGIDLLYPIQRYVDALTKNVVVDRDGDLVANPLFAGGRSAELVAVAGIVGVPWQDVATDDSLEGAGLEFLGARELTDKGRWDVIVGGPSTYSPPTDPLMIESVSPRSGKNPIIGAAIAPADSTDPQANPINGHEYLAEGELQYTCIFPLAQPVDCSGAPSGCDCTSDDVDNNRPLCNPPDGGPAGTTQFFAKAFPGLRHLELLKALDERAVTTSICPKDVEAGASHPSFGLNPAARAIARRISSMLE